MEDKQIKNTQVKMVEIPPTEDQLALGWFFNEKKREWRLAKVRQEDRETHLYVIGATGVGKSKLLEYLILQDLHFKRGFGVIDPAGDLIENIKSYLPLFFSEEELEKEIILIDPLNPKEVVTFNPLEREENISPEEQALQLTEVFKKIWQESWGARMENILNNTFTALTEANLTICELPLFLTNFTFRKKVLSNVSNLSVLQFFQRYNSWTERIRNEWIESSLNKIEAFLIDSRIRQMLGSQKSSFNFREIMDKRKILLVKLDRGRLLEAGDLLGALMMTKIKLTAFSRGNIPKEERVPFYLYTDEFQHFATDSFIETLAEARKYKLSLVLAHQNISQLSRKLRDSILANCGLQIYFRISREDAEILTKEAFRVTGTEVKYYDINHGHPQFFTLMEEREQLINQLQDLENQVFLAYNKKAGERIFLSSYPLEEEKTLSEELEKKIGRNYLRERGKIEKEISERTSLFLSEEEPKDFQGQAITI